MNLKKHLSAVMILFAGATAASAVPVGTSFTYQGKLDQSGTPADGEFDLQIGLFDDPSAGGLVAPVETLEDVEVTLGVFTVALDFGAVFSSETALWLEISVREGASTGPYTTLVPRQRLTPTPFALDASNADHIDNLDSTDLLQASGASMTGDLEIVGSAIELIEGNHLGGMIFADPDGLTISTPGNDRVRVQSKLSTTENLGVGIENPLQMLEVNGALALGTTTTQTLGTIRWNGTDFEGYDGGGWQSLTAGNSAGNFVDLTSDQTVDGSKTFLDRVTADGGLTSLDTLRVGGPSQSESLEIYTIGGALDLFRVGGAQFGELRTNSSNDFILQALNGKLRTQGDLYLQFSDTSSFRDLFVGDVRVHDGILFQDDTGVNRGQFQRSGNNVAYFDGSGDGYLEVRDRLHVTGDSTDRYLTFGTSTSDRITFEEGTSQSRDLDVRLGTASDGTFRVLGNGAFTRALDVGGTLDVDDDVEVGGNLIVSSIPTGANDGQVCFDSTIFGDIFIRCSSSRRYKENFSVFTSGLDVVRRLRPVTFEWRRNGQADLGFVAEEVADIDPLLATYSQGEVDGVKYDRLTTVLVNAIQEQQSQIEALRALLCRDHADAVECLSSSPENNGLDGVAVVSNRAD